jgi:hypothetical protein
MPLKKVALHGRCRSKAIISYALAPRHIFAQQEYQGKNVRN